MDYCIFYVLSSKKFTFYFEIGITWTNAKYGIPTVGYLVGCILVKQIFKQDLVWNVTTLEPDDYCVISRILMRVFYLR
jgi:hypothetical protein